MCRPCKAHELAGASTCVPRGCGDRGVSVRCFVRYDFFLQVPFVRPLKLGDARFPVCRASFSAGSRSARAWGACADVPPKSVHTAPRWCTAGRCIVCARAAIANLSAVPCLAVPPRLLAHRVPLLCAPVCTRVGVQQRRRACRIPGTRPERLEYACCDVGSTVVRGEIVQQRRSVWPEGARANFVVTANRQRRQRCGSLMMVPIDRPRSSSSSCCCYCCCQGGSCGTPGRGCA